MPTAHLSILRSAICSTAGIFLKDKAYVLIPGFSCKVSVASVYWKSLVENIVGIGSSVIQLEISIENGYLGNGIKQNESELANIDF